VPATAAEEAAGEGRRGGGAKRPRVTREGTTRGEGCANS
jgi:hypothetical protein